MEKYGTRTDCTRDNRQTICSNATLIGSSTNVAKRGTWIVYETDNHHHCGRVVGGVTCEGKRYLEIIATGVGFEYAFVRWIEPHSVRSCYTRPPHGVIAFLVGEWSDADAILTRAHHGVTLDRAVYPAGVQPSITDES